MKIKSLFVTLVLFAFTAMSLATPAFAKGGGGGCFLSGNQITGPDGRSTAAIQSVRPGDKILAFTKDNTLVCSAVSKVYCASADSYLVLKTARHTVAVTVDHPFYIDSGEFKKAGDLKIGDNIMVLDGRELKAKAITSLKLVKARVLVYNLETENPNTFFAGNIAVHNKGGGGFSGGGGRGGSVSSGGSRGGSTTSSSSSGSSWGGKSASNTTPAPAPAGNQSSSWGAKGGSTPTGSQSASVASNRSTIMTQQKASNLKAQAVETKNFTSKTSSTDWKVSQTKFSSGKVTYTPKVGTHSQDASTRTVVYNRYYNQSPYGGYCYADPFNHSMIWMFSTMWWYHNWNQVDRELYKDDIRMKELEKEIEKLKAQNIKVDPKYRDPGMDEAVMYNEGYLQAVKDGKISEATYVADKPEEEKHWYSCFIDTLMH